MNPVDLEAFVNDKEVQEIIEKGAGTVIITQGSDPGLIAGNQKVTGLDPHKYYMVEEWDESGNPISVQFVRTNGGRSEKLTDIGLSSGGEISGLTNHYNYRVKSAGPLSGNVSFNALSSPPPSGGTAVNTGGGISLSVPESGSVVYTLTPPPPTTTLSLSDFEIVKVPVAPAGSASTADRSGDALFTIINKDMVLDYVFYGTIGAAPNITHYFYVLRVTAVPVPPEPKIVIQVTLSFSGDNSPQTNETKITYSQSDNDPIEISVNNASQYDNHTTTGIEWYIDGTQKGTGANFTLQIDQIEYKIIGTYFITVEAAIGGIPYSTTIEVVVTQ